MKNNFFIKLAKKDEKMTLLKIATVLCFIIYIIIRVVSILNRMDYTVYFLLDFLIYFLLGNTLIIIYLKFKVNGEVNKFFKLNYILLIFTMGFYSIGIMITIFFIINVYKCFKFAKIFSENKKNFWLSLLGFFIVFFTLRLLYEVYSFFFKILVLLLGILVVSIIYLYSKKINKIPSLNFLFLLLTEICFLTRILPYRLVLGTLLLIITIIVNIRVIFPKIKPYTNFSKIQKIILIVGILFSLFSKVYIIEKQEQIETISKQESDTNNSNENITSE